MFARTWILSSERDGDLHIDLAKNKGLKASASFEWWDSCLDFALNSLSSILNLFQVQYQYLYDLAIDYLDCFDTYANFESSIWCCG